MTKDENGSENKKVKYRTLNNENETEKDDFSYSYRVSDWVNLTMFNNRVSTAFASINKLILENPIFNGKRYKEAKEYVINLLRQNGFASLCFFDKDSTQLSENLNGIDKTDPLLRIQRSAFPSDKFNDNKQLKSFKLRPKRNSKPIGIRCRNKKNKFCRTDKLARNLELSENENIENVESNYDEFTDNKNEDPYIALERYLESRDAEKNKGEESPALNVAYFKELLKPRKGDNYNGEIKMNYKLLNNHFKKKHPSEESNSFKLLNIMPLNQLNQKNSTEEGDNFSLLESSLNTNAFEESKNINKFDKSKLENIQITKHRIKRDAFEDESLSPEDNEKNYRVDHFKEEVEEEVEEKDQAHNRHLENGLGYDEYFENEYPNDQNLNLNDYLENIALGRNLNNLENDYDNYQQVYRSLDPNINYRDTHILTRLEEIKKKEREAEKFKILKRLEELNKEQEADDERIKKYNEPIESETPDLLLKLNENNKNEERILVGHKDSNKNLETLYGRKLEKTDANENIRKSNSKIVNLVSLEKPTLLNKEILELNYKFKFNNKRNPKKRYNDRPKIIKVLEKVVDQNEKKDFQNQSNNSFHYFNNNSSRSQNANPPSMLGRIKNKINDYIILPIGLDRDYKSSSLNKHQRNNSETEVINFDHPDKKKTAEKIESEMMPTSFSVNNDDHFNLVKMQPKKDEIDSANESQKTDENSRSKRSFMDYEIEFKEDLNDDFTSKVEDVSKIDERGVCMIYKNNIDSLFECNRNEENDLEIEYIDC